MKSDAVCFPKVFDGVVFSSREVIDVLTPLITESRLGKMREVIEGRTYNIVPVVEGLYDLGNVNAVMRSAEALGFQKFHIIQNGDRFKVANRVTKGTDRWLEVKKWVTTSDWIKFIRDQGYRIAVTHLSDESIPIGEVDFSIPTAVVFGNEKDGISEEMVLKSDLSFVIPMSGFAQSFNISVAAAISLYHIVEDRRRRPGGHSDLSDLDKQELLAQYCLNTVTHGEQILLNSKETLPL